jgi:hypothetical protein
MPGAAEELDALLPYWEGSADELLPLWCEENLTADFVLSPLLLPVCPLGAATERFARSIA